MFTVTVVLLFTPAGECFCVNGSIHMDRYCSHICVFFFYLILHCCNAGQSNVSVDIIEARVALMCMGHVDL